MDALSSCLTSELVQAGGDFTLDCRYYFMDNEGNGRASCDVVRTTIATLLREKCPAGDFLTPKWFSGLAKAGKNPSICGFMVEHMTLSLMTLESLPSFNLQLFRSKPALVELFPGDVPSRPMKKGLILYIPTKHQYEAVDGILVHWGEPQNKTKRRMAGDPETMSVMGVQITLDKEHKNREKEFLARWCLGFSVLQRGRVPLCWDCGSGVAQIRTGDGRGDHERPAQRPNSRLPTVQEIVYHFKRRFAGY